MNNDLKISLVQASLHWEDIKQNLVSFSEKLAALEGKTDLIILPEMFTTGFSMNAEVVAEGMDGITMNWLRAQAATLKSAITGSFIATENGQYYNRLIFMKPDGSYAQYDKRHLFTLAKEHQTYQAGTERLIVDWKGWKICPLICYDLLIYVANWPETRALHWKSLLTARAIENQCYTVGVNRVGVDEKGFVYSGDTSMIDYSGTSCYTSSKVEDVFTIKLSKSSQNAYRSKLDFLPDRDSYQIRK